VWVNDAPALEGFTFGEIAGPIALPEGSYNVKICPAGQTDCVASPLLTADVDLDAGMNYSLVAHLEEGGAPTISAFVNDVSRPRWWKARIAVHHTAAAPTVDIQLDGGRRWWKRTINIENFSNGDRAVAEVWNRIWYVSIFPAGSETSVFDTGPLRLKPRRTYLVYAVGSLTYGTFTLLVEEVAPTRYIHDD
jgi:hypothetical protein